MTALVPCPLCGASEGYGHSTSRVFDCDYELWCRACKGTVVAQVADSEVEFIAAWNSAGAHAQALRERVAALSWMELKP